jgi:AcrR family transcriptional regulator
MEAIAERAGVGKATVYRWWPAKELVIVDAIARLTAAIPVPDTGSVDGDVLALMRVSVRRYRDPATAALLSGLVAAMARSAPIAAAVRSGFLGRWRAAMIAVLRRGVARGELRPDLDESTSLDLLSGPAFYRFLMLGQPVDESMARGVVAVVLRGLAPEADGRRKPVQRRGSRMQL